MSGNGPLVVNVGEHFTDSQEKAEGFKKVAKAWASQCMDYDKGLELLSEAQAKIVDFRGPLKQWEVNVYDDGLYFLHKPSLQKFKPTEHCIGQIAVIANTSKFWLYDMINDKGEIGDLAVVRDCLNRTLFNPERTDMDKERLIRCWNDGSMRAMLSNRYAIVNNVWFMDLMRKLIPNGLLSHWRGDADTVLGNILIPDSIREFGADEFGALLSVGNSEIGERRVYTEPSAFRAICMNGCIWHKESGKAVNRRHIGKGGEINLKDLEGEIAENLNNAIPLTTEIIQAIIGLRKYKFDAANLVPTIAEFFNQFNINKKFAVPYMQALNVERDCGTANDNAFFLLQGVTRMAQELSNKEWVDFDRLGGEISQFSGWGKLFERAKSIGVKQVENALGEVAHLA